MRLRPSKRTLTRLGIGAALIVGLLLIANAFMSWRVETRFQAKVEAIRAAGDPASIAELKPAPIPADENAAAHIDKLEPRLSEFQKEYIAFYKTPLGKAYEALDEGEPATAEQLAAMKTLLDTYVDLEEMIAAAAAAPFYASTADFSLGFQKFLDVQLPRLTRIKDAARMADWRTEVLMAEGRRDDTVRRWLQLLQLAKLHESEPSLISFLVSVSVRSAAIHGIHRALDAGPVSTEVHEELDRELARQDDPASIEKALRLERAISVSASLEQTSGPAPASWVGLVGWPVKGQFIAPLDFYEQVLPMADLPWPEIQKKFAKGGALSAPTGHGVLADLLLPAFDAAIRASRRDIALIRSLRIINALQQFAEKNGREATGLAELELPKSAMIDPFSGKPLIAKHIDDGWLVYSVMENGVDDGGDFEEKDRGLRPRKRSK